MAASQAQTLAETQAAPPSTPPNGVKVIIPSALVLDQPQEQRMLDYFRDELQRVETDLGRTDFENEDWLAQPVTDLRRSTASFFGRRHLAHLVHQQRMDWRAFVLGGLYAESNLHLPITTRIIGQQEARANKSFFGTSPWFSVSGLSADSDPLASDVHAYGHHQLVTLGGLQGNLESAVGLAFVQGETVVKTRHHKLVSYFESYREIAIDPANNQPFVAQDGDYIYKTDLFIQAPADPTLPVSESPSLPVSPAMVLKRDGVTPQPAPDMAPLFQTVKIDLSKILADKIEAKPIYYLDFLCALDNPSVQDGCVFHLYNTSVIEMAHRYLTDTEWDTASVEEQMGRIRRLVAEFITGTSEEKQAKADRPRAELAENATSHGTLKVEPTVGLVECWGWYDPFGDGVMRSVMCLMDRDGNLPVFYDYTANLTPDGLRPFDVLRINPIAGRWHGQGNVERFWNLQEHADLLLNRYLFAESRAARVDFFNPEAVTEGAGNPNLELNWGGTYHLKQGFKAEDALTSVYLTNIKNANLKDLLEIVMQMATNMSSVSNVNDASMVSLDAQKTATGIRNLERSGEEMFHQYLTQLQPSIESICRRSLKYLLSLVRDLAEKDRISRFFDRASSRMIEIDPLKLADLDLDISLELTTYRSQAQMQQAQMGYNMASAYLMQPPPIQMRLESLVKQFLKALEIRNADEIAAPLTPEEQMMLMPPAPPGAPGALPDATNPEPPLPL